MLVNDFLCPPFSPHEEYFRQLCLQSPALYTNTLYNLFGHLFISNTDFVHIDAELEKINHGFVFRSVAEMQSAIAENL